MVAFSSSGFVCCFSPSGFKLLCRSLIFIHFLYTTLVTDSVEFTFVRAFGSHLGKSWIELSDLSLLGLAYFIFRD